MDTKEKIIEILMNRDDISRVDAESIVEETQIEINQALTFGDPFEIEDILAYNLGLELDYMWAFM